jgi:uracil-DNA glycosylase
VAAVAAASRSDELAALRTSVSGCTACRLAETRTQVVFGSGDSDSELMFVGEAPGFHEDQQGLPFVGSAGKLLERLLGEIGLTRDNVFIGNVLKCLRYNALVQLGDGSWERIGRLVRAKYEGTVMSVSADGSIVPRRVIGWHESPLGGRRVFKLTYRSAKNAGAGRVSIQLTGDHPVLTERGFVPAEELRVEDRIATGQGLSQLAYDVACGTVLGDGHLNSGRAHLTFSHSMQQKEYALFKASLLTELQPRLGEFFVAAVVGGERAYPVVQVRTRAHRAFGVLRRDFYRPKKVVPEWLETDLNERMLAFWFMDDGHTRIRPGRQPLSEIATVGFSDRDLQVLLRGLERLGLPAKALRHRLHFDVQSTRALSELIAPYVPASMRYKLHPEIALRVPFDSGRLETGPPITLYDAVEIQDITDEPRNDTSFFCLDVDETRNFVTAGGVVHNCRPPGNRDPLADEIEACQGHLFRQIELIQPRVVATLGNFATKLLSGSPAGITRVHGREQSVRLGNSQVLLYPIYHPAAALYTQAMLGVLEEDFRRLPELLERGSTALAQPIAVSQSALAVEPTAENPELQLGLF